MMDRLRALLNCQVAPGASYVHISPFSFPWGVRVIVNANAGEQSPLVENVSRQLNIVADYLDSDKLIEGRNSLASVQALLAEHGYQDLSDGNG